MRPYQRYTSALIGLLLAASACQRAQANGTGTTTANNQATSPKSSPLLPLPTAALARVNAQG
ncbi:MAG TPA: hypothetical protein VIV60_10445, partial [Polyangiaceae bacterium]